ECPGEQKDFRAEQCAEFNGVPFEGIYYDWIPYTGGPNKCELNCMPRGERFFYRHRQMVIDGTPCETEKNDVCVGGKCMHVGCDMMLGSDVREDVCRECGGDGSNCNTVSGLFDTDDLQAGYVDIILIPQGATNVVVKEIEPSNNYLAIRNTSGNYYLNGNWRIDFPRSLKFAGTIFHYSRDPQGFSAPDTITALGPTSEPIYVVDHNVGVHYEYSVPKRVSSHTDADSYTWITDEFSSCSATCGGGSYQSRRVACVRRRDRQPVDESLCDPQMEPADTEACNVDPCPPAWVEGEWGRCSKHCGEGGEQSRRIKCEQVVSGGIPTVVDDSQCLEKVGPKGPTTQECNKDVACPQFHVGPWKPCDRLCGPGKQTRRVTCYKKVDGKIQVLEDQACEEEAPEREKPCELRPCAGLDWVTSDWSGCDDKCGLTEETRTTYCATQDGTVYPDEKCDGEKKPELTRDCEAKKDCEFLWFASQWSNCSAKCGSGVQTRKVFCGTYDDETVKKAPDEKCDAAGKFNETKNCTAEEECKGEWFAGPWSKCSKPCGGGTMTRKVICMKANKTVPLNNCDSNTIIFSTENCNDQACEEDEVIPMQPEKIKDLAEEEDDECEVYEDEDFVTVSSSLAPSDKSSRVTDLTEATPLSSPDTSDTTSSDIYDKMQGDEGPTRGDISPSAMETVEGSGSDYTDPLFTYTSEFEGSGTSETTDESFTTVSGTTESVEGSTEDSTGESMTQETTESGETDLTTESGATEETTSDQTTETLGSTESGATEVTTESSETEASGSMESTESAPTTSSSETESTVTEQTISTEVTPTEESGASTITVPEVKGEPEEETEESPVTGETTESGVTEGSTVSGSTEPTMTTESGATETTESGATTEFGATTETVATETTESTESGATTESEGTTESGATEATESTESGATTEATESTESGATTETTESGSTGTTESGMTTESGETTTEGSTVSGETTESGATTESGSTETTESGATTESGETTVSGVTDTTVSGLTPATDEEETETTETTHVSELWTTISPEETTRKHRVCKVPKKKKTCKTSPFGCCYDGITAAEGPFGQGCPTIQTCNETKYGCCSDGVSAATGPENQGCPESHCEETLFGCCPDGVTAAEGNDLEGCKKPCNETEFGCCPDNETPASGKDNMGCCNATEFGCCPDGIKPASGPDEEGCEEETTSVMAVTEEYEGTTLREDCANTTYGCCPDGITPALGPNNDGCHMPCENSTYGCCDDGSTPAHGPNREGCCLSTPFKCCPDNILPARGPDFYGCGCQYTRFGCCPDNSTAARGPNNEGCGCKYTPHGCCPNRFTPATGPNYQGCSCYTYQFGCCPDGVTIAKGPHGQGCGCENTEFKCCSDGRTPAKGPNFAGCTCDASKYGCCPDGSEEAQGENFEGCLSVPPTPGAACALERDRGPCRDFTVKWYFDTEYGGCSRFWYGGCEGNDNRFKTQEECKEVCVQPKGKDACNLPKISGPCEGYFPTWYYDTGRKQCGQFVYGGCLGNANKFKTREECEELCVTPDDLDPCEQTKEPGPCEGNFTRWYFNAESQACEQFRYGGCKGNDNNFATEIACHQQCLQPGRRRVKLTDVCRLEKDTGPCPGSVLRWHYDAARQTCSQFLYGGCKGNANRFRTRAACEQRCPVKDSCLLPRAEGNCGEKQSRWYFDQSENRCMPFYYTGCGGNKNNFESRDACESDCPAKIEQDTCLLPALLGECHNYTQRWYHDSYEQQCRQFYYGGCGGNENNFITEQDCVNRCQTTITTSAPSREVEFRPDFCFLPDEHGPCSEEHVKWFYDSREGVCKQFRYGGCQSNGNNFNSREECEYRCGDVQDPCTLPKVVGPCNGFVRQYYYDHQSDSCYEFEYSGCQGNKNRFQDKESCESKCQRRSRTEVAAHVTPAPVETSSKSPICYATVDPGSCNGDITAFYYDAHNQMCQAFIYGGCEGNANRFQTEEQCERLCGKFHGQDTCNLPVDPGECRGSFQKYYYDPVSRICREFVYGGCEGNANRFSTMAECESICIHHEEPVPSGNDTSLSTICKEPVDIGSCTSGSTKRFYFDEELQTCRAFIYTGCGGNRNRFKTFESCINTCLSTTNEIDVDSGKDTKDPCTEAREECNTIRCPYGKEAFVDSQDCERCRCVDPCRTQICPDNTKCAITLVATKDGTEYKGVCRSVTKPGQCPSVSNSTRCEQECLTDADCAGEMKCCNNGCGASCLEPPAEDVPATSPRVPVTVPPVGAEPASIKQPEEPKVSAQEGGYVTLTCIALGNPKPAVTWRKGTTLIAASESRRRILLDGSLQIINLDRYDGGTYVCTADNGLGPPVRAEYQLVVTEPKELAAAIVGEPNTHVTVTMNSPISLHCYAWGWPRPFVTWWQGDRMLPLTSELYEQDSEYTLLIRSVTLPTLGVYTCQAFNAIGRAASWSVTLQAVGPVYNVKPEYEKYLKYLVDPPRKHERPQYPHRPNRTQTSDSHTYGPAYTTRQFHVPTASPIGYTTLDYGTKFRVPVTANISIGQNQFPEGSDITIACNVDGYPIPRVSWYKDNELIHPNNRIQITDLNRLVISVANREDSGRYRCEANNDYSSATSTVDIQVAGIFIHPNCQDNSFFAKCDLIVEARYCTHKYYAKFCCRSCTEAGQLPSRGPHLNTLRRRRRITAKQTM
ncbi:hypothetical protein E2986_10746, partial [Frieseomelitta varia]